MVIRLKHKVTRRLSLTMFSLLTYCFTFVYYILTMQTFTNQANIFHVSIFDSVFMSFLMIIFVENFFTFMQRACYKIHRCMTLLWTLWCLRSEVVFSLYIIVSC